jgi:hypothetical protein
MTKRLNRPAPVRTETLECCQTRCPLCGGPTYQQYTKHRTVVTLQGVIGLRRNVRLRSAERRRDTVLTGLFGPI